MHILSISLWSQYVLNVFMAQRAYEKLIVWQEAFSFCIWVYELTKQFPQDERYCLTQQVRRSAVSVISNIAEGNGKRSKPDRIRFLEMSLGSLEELHCQMRLSLALNYIHSGAFQMADDWTHRISYLINKLQSSLR